jgi:hypothetical protein
MFFVLIFLACLSCKEKINIAKEKEAILKVLQEEGNAYAANDQKRVFAVFIQDSTSLKLEQRSSNQIYTGWDEIKKSYESELNFLISNNTFWKNPKNQKENIIIKVVGNSAWVLCDNIWKYEANNAEVKTTNMQIAFFVKINGEWKFSFNGFIQKP